MRNTILILALSLLLTACGSTINNKENDSFNNKNNDKEIVNNNKTKNDEINKKTNIKKASKESVERLKALEARGFYIAATGDINYLNNRVCNNFEIQSHRGHVKYPENSIDSIRNALWNGFDVVEIDVMANKDGTWVLHHDKKTGRATGTVDNKKREIYRTRDKELSYISHRNMETGELLNIRIPTAREAFTLFNYVSKEGQYLNIEIKGELYASSLEKLEFLAFKTITNKRYYFSSSEYKNLERLREINPNIRLNYIMPVNYDSFIVEKNKIKKGVANDPIYEREKRKRGFNDSYENEEKGRRNYNKRLVKKDRDFLMKTIGSNYSFSFDIRSYKDFSQNKINKYRRNNIPISTYSINGQEYHNKVLKSLPKSKLPDSVIIDDTVYGFCSQWGLPKKKPFTTNDEVAKGIYDLPIDVDLERINELSLYSSSGLYPSINGNLKPYKQLKVKEARRLKVGKKQEEEDFELATGKKIKVELRNEQ